jgi:molybdopterin-guanine dinucleotide biosynthesis protein A
MGSDKALLLWEGIPLLQRVCTVATACCEVVYVLTPWQERYQHTVRAVRWLKEPQPGLGALAALAQALPEIPTPWVLVLACDLPQLRPEVLQGWSARLPGISDQVLAMVPWYADRWEPLCAFYRSQAQHSLQQFVQQGGRSFQAWLSQNPVQSIAVDSYVASMLWNCNRPEDLIGG